MNDKNNINQKYWRMVFGIAWRSAWDKAEMKALILALIAIVTTIAVTGVLFAAGIIESPFFRDNALFSSIAGFVQCGICLAILMIAFIVLLHGTPPKLHHEQQVNIDQLKSESDNLSQKLLEQTKPKLSFEYSPQDQNLNRGNGVEYWTRVRIRNSGGAAVSGIKVKLEEIEPSPNFGFPPPQLHFSSDSARKEQLSPGEVLYVDVVQVSKRKNPMEMFFYTEMENQRQNILYQDYVVTLVVYGAETSSKTAKYRFVAEASNERLHKFEEIENETT